MSSSPTTKLLRKNTRITRKIILAHFWGQLGVIKNGLQIDLKLSGWMSYPNSLMELCLCLVVFVYWNISNFWQFLVKFLPHSLQLLVLWPLFCLKSWNPDLCETQKYVEILNKTWMITFHIGILVIFYNFWANICLVHSTYWLSGCIFAWNHGRQIFSFRIILKSVPILKYHKNFWRKQK